MLMLDDMCSEPIFSSKEKQNLLEIGITAKIATDAKRC